MWDKSYQYIKNMNKSLYTGHKLIMSNFGTLENPQQNKRSVYIDILLMLI